MDLTWACPWSFPSRRLVPVGPRLAGPGGAPHRTYDLDPRGAVWSPSVRDGRYGAGVGFQERPGPGSEAPAAGGYLRVLGLEALPAGGAQESD
jgi:hypothetical protein